MFFQRAQSPHPSRLGGIQIFSDSEGRFLFVSGDPQPERVFAHSRSGRDPVPAADGSGAGDGTAGSVGSMGGHSLLGGAAAGADGGPLLEGNRPVLSGFLSGAPVDCRGVRTSGTRETSPGLLARRGKQGGNDASLLLINSGMAPMKPWFTGEEEPPRHRV